MSALIDGISWVCLVVGGLFCVIGAVGLLRMPDFYTRMHAASVIETLGAGLILLGLILQAGATLVAVKLLMLGLLILFVSPTATCAGSNRFWRTRRTQHRSPSHQRPDGADGSHRVGHRPQPEFV